MNPAAQAPPVAPVPSQGHPDIQGSGMEMDPGSLGQMDTSHGGSYSGVDEYGSGESFEEPPLLVELGIDFELIKQKVIIHVLVRLVAYLVLGFLCKYCRSTIPPLSPDPLCTEPPSAD